MILPEPFSVTLTFHGDLSSFLKRSLLQTTPGQVVRQLRERASVKDVIESCGVPHPEVGRILVNREPVNFTCVLQNNCSIDIYPVGFTNGPSFGEGSQERHIEKFVVDGHLGKLARNLRLLGFDTVYQTQADDLQLLEIMASQQRALLTRDRRLLMHSIVQTGYCPRSHSPEEQTVEVMRRFDLANRATPFTRCLHCNTPLIVVAKSDVFDQLEPLTRLYYEQFRRCPGCNKIYWRGSHFSKLETTLLRLRGQCAAAPA